MKNINSINQRVKKYAYAETSALYQDFHISTDGYSNEQAENSRAQYGENLIVEQKADTVWHCLRRAFVNPFTIILFVLASISFITDHLSQIVSTTIFALRDGIWKYEYGDLPHAERIRYPI